MNALILHPQMHRVHAIDSRFKSAETLAHNPETAHMGRDLIKWIRHDIVAEKPHRMEHAHTMRAYYEPLPTAKAWRERINTRLAVIKKLAESPVREKIAT